MTYKIQVMQERNAVWSFMEKMKFTYYFNKLQDIQKCIKLHTGMVARPTT
jgi:hypothetical protein